MTETIQCILAGETPPPIAGDAIAAKITELFAKGGAKLEASALFGGDNASAAMIEVGETTISIRAFAQPIPPALVTEAAALERRPTHSDSLFAADKAHVAMTVASDCPDHGSSIEAARALTAVAAAMADLHGLDHGLWISGRKIWAKEDLARAGDATAGSDAPGDLWVGANFFQGDKSAPGAPQVGGYTYGLAPFIGRELEMEPEPGDPREAMMRFMALVKWFLRDGLFLGSGDTIGGEGAELRATFSDAGKRVKAPVVTVVNAVPAEGAE
ncbi:MAG: hypothetical protein AAF360_12580 [Pseudomonadota bacterium]